MELPRRVFLQLAAAAAALPATTRMASAADYPTRPVRILVGFPPGATIAAHIIAQWLSDRLGQQFIVENRPGAATNIATEAVVRAPTDGYTLLAATANNTVNGAVYQKLSISFRGKLRSVNSPTYWRHRHLTSSSMTAPPILIHPSG